MRGRLLYLCVGGGRICPEGRSAWDCCVEGESVLEDGRRGLDSPGGRIGVRLLTGAEFGDRMKKIFSEFFVLDFMRTEKFREHIVRIMEVLGHG